MDRKKGVNATTHITLLYCTSSTFWLYKENSLLEDTRPKSQYTVLFLL
jgi:hypothetical protein